VPPDRTQVNTHKPARVESVRISAEAHQRPVPRNRTALILWNTHNHTHGDRGAKICNVLLSRNGTTVWEKNGFPLAWDPGGNPPTVVDLPPVAFDRVRIDVVEWNGVGGGLAEIEIYRGGRNIARGAYARTSRVYSTTGACGPTMATDGNIDQEADGKGYWLLPTHTPGWIEIDLGQDADVRVAGIGGGTVDTSGRQSRRAALPADDASADQSRHQPLMRPAPRDSESGRSATDFSRIELPTGAVFLREAFGISKGQLAGMFPLDASVCILKYPSGTTESVITHDDGKLRGPAARFYQDGQLHVLVEYDSLSRIHGMVRVFDEDGYPQLYAQYAQGKKSGMVCLFRHNVPYLIQRWDKGTLMGEYFVISASEGPKAISAGDLAAEDAEKHRKSAEELLALESRMDDQEQETRKELKAWWREQELEARQKRVRELNPQRRRAGLDRIRARYAEDGSAMQRMWQGALRRSGL